MSVPLENEFIQSSPEDEEVKVVRLNISQGDVVLTCVYMIFPLLLGAIMGFGVFMLMLLLCAAIGILFFKLASIRRIEYRMCDDYFTYIPFFGDNVIIYLDEVGSITSTKKFVRSRRFKYTVHSIRIDYRNPEPDTGESHILVKKSCLHYSEFEHFIIQKIPEAFYGRAAKCLYR